MIADGGMPCRTEGHQWLPEGQTNVPVECKVCGARRVPKGGRWEYTFPQPERTERQP